MSTNSKKIVIDLCGGSGAWSKPYAESGYDVRVITLPENDVRNYQLPDGNIYGILAAPPCTMFSLARTRAKTPRDLREGMEVVEACMKLIWEARTRGTLKFWALENPLGYLRQFLGKPAFCFEPYQFGHPYSKKTDIWGYFNAPKKIHNRKLTGFPSIAHIVRNPAKRAITPEGFARAFFSANQ